MEFKPIFGSPILEGYVLGKIPEQSVDLVSFLWNLVSAYGYFALEIAD